MKTFRSLALSLLTLALTSTGSIAQTAASPAEKPKEGSSGNRRGFSQANIEEYRKKAAERVKTALKVSDEEWTVLQPLIENVQTKLRDTYSSRTGGFGRGGDRPGTESARPGQLETQNLQTTLENEASSLEEVKAKLNAVRDSRKKTQAALAQAGEELRKVLTVRQEAALVGLGLLE